MKYPYDFKIRGSSTDIAGIYPWLFSNNLPMIGAPLGKHLITESLVCCDPMTWFIEDHIKNPSMFILGEPGYGKSALVCRICIYNYLEHNVIPIILGDVKGEYVSLIKHLDGNIVELNTDRGFNILDFRDLANVDEYKKGEYIRRVINLVKSIIVLNRSSHEIDDIEKQILINAFQIISADNSLCELRDLLNVIYDKTLSKSIESVFVTYKYILNSNNQIKPDINKPLCIDISKVTRNSDRDVTAVAMLTTWCVGNNILTLDSSNNNYLLVLDELWEPLQTEGSKDIVKNIDALTRLNRQWGVGQIMITHSLMDLESSLLATAKTFIQKAAIVAMCALPDIELERISKVAKLTKKECELVTSWFTPKLNESKHNAGTGKFLIKVGDLGIPVQVILSEKEKNIHNTNLKFRQKQEDK